MHVCVSDRLPNRDVNGATIEVSTIVAVKSVEN